MASILNCYKIPIGITKAKHVSTPTSILPKFTTNGNRLFSLQSLPNDSRDFHARDQTFTEREFYTQMGVDPTKSYPPLQFMDDPNRDISRDLPELFAYNREAVAWNKLKQQEYDAAQKSLNQLSKDVPRISKNIRETFVKSYTTKGFFGEEHDKNFDAEILARGGLIDPQKKDALERYNFAYKNKTWNPKEWFQRFTETWGPIEIPLAEKFEDPMTKNEALKILNISASEISSVSERVITDHHRRMMLALHPDSGGNAFLAGKINEAKFELEKAAGEQKAEEEEKKKKEAERKKETADPNAPPGAPGGPEKQRKSRTGGAIIDDSKPAEGKNKAASVEDETKITNLSGPYDLDDLEARPSDQDFVYAHSKLRYFMSSPGSVAGPIPLVFNNVPFTDTASYNALSRTVAGFDRSRHGGRRLMLEKDFDDRKWGTRKLKSWPMRYGKKILLPLWRKNQVTGGRPAKALEDRALGLRRKKKSQERDKDGNIIEEEEEEFDDETFDFMADTPVEKAYIEATEAMLRGEAPVHPGEEKGEDSGTREMLAKNRWMDEKYLKDPDLAADPEYMEEKLQDEEDEKAILEKGGKIYERSVDDIIQEHEEIWDPIMENEKSRYWNEDFEHGELMVKLSMQDKALMHRIQNKTMLENYANREEIKKKNTEDPAWESDYDIDRDGTIIGQLRAFYRREKRRIELESEAERRINGENIPDTERIELMQRREKIEDKNLIRRIKEKERAKLIGWEKVISETGPEFEDERMRQDRNMYTVKNSNWEYHHWFEGEPEDYEDQFELDDYERRDLADMQEEVFDEEEAYNDRQERRDWFHTKKRKKRRKKFRSKFRITPQTIAERKRWYRFKASQKWDRFEDAFWYAAFPKSSLSHMEHDAKKIFFPNAPTRETEEQDAKHKFEVECAEIEQKKDFINELHLFVQGKLTREQVVEARMKRKEKMDAMFHRIERAMHPTRSRIVTIDNKDEVRFRDDQQQLK